MKLTLDKVGKSFTAGSAIGYENLASSDTRFVFVDGYEDVYVNDDLAYMLGESCFLKGYSNDKVLLRNDNNDFGKESFYLSRELFEKTFTENTD